MSNTDPEKTENIMLDASTLSENKCEQSSISGNDLNLECVSNSTTLPVPASTAASDDDYDSVLQAFYGDEKKPDANNKSKEVEFSSLLIQSANASSSKVKIDASQNSQMQNFTSGGFQAPNPNLRINNSQNIIPNIGIGLPNLAPNMQQPGLSSLPYSNMPIQPHFNQRPLQNRPARPNLMPALLNTGLTNNSVSNNNAFKDMSNKVYPLLDLYVKKEITYQTFVTKAEEYLGPNYLNFLNLLNKGSGSESSVASRSFATNSNLNGGLTPRSNVYNYSNVSLPGNQPLNSIWDNSGRQGLNVPTSSKTLPLQGAVASQRVQAIARPPARALSKKVPVRNANSPQPLASSQQRLNGGQQPITTSQPGNSRANSVLSAPLNLNSKPQPPTNSSSAPADSKECDDYTDVLGSVGVNLKEESEKVFNGALGQSAFLQRYGSQLGFNGAGSSQIVPSPLSFLDQKSLLTRVKQIAKSAGLEVDPLICELLTLAVEEKVREITEFTVKSSKHRYKANQPLPPPPVNQHGKPIYTIKVASDPRKQLQALERYDKAEQRQFEEDLNRPQQDDDNDPKSKRSKSRKDGHYGSVVNPKNISDEARKRNADQTSIMAIGGPQKSWMISSSAPRNPSPLGSTPPVNASNLNAHKTSALNNHQPNVSSNLVPKDQARNRAETVPTQTQSSDSGQSTLAPHRANIISIPGTPSTARSLRSSTAGTIIDLNDVIYALENEIATIPNTYVTKILKRAYSRRR